MLRHRRLGVQIFPPAAGPLERRRGDANPAGATPAAPLCVASYLKWTSSDFRARCNLGRPVGAPRACSWSRGFNFKASERASARLNGVAWQQSQVVSAERQQQLAPSGGPSCGPAAPVSSCQLPVPVACASCQRVALPPISGPKFKESPRGQIYEPAAACWRLPSGGANKLLVRPYLARLETGRARDKLGRQLPRVLESIMWPKQVERARSLARCHLRARCKEAKTRPGRAELEARVEGQVGASARPPARAGLIWARLPPSRLARAAAVIRVGASGRARCKRMFSPPLASARGPSARQDDHDETIARRSSGGEKMASAGWPCLCVAIMGRALGWPASGPEGGQRQGWPAGWLAEAVISKYHVSRLLLCALGARLIGIHRLAGPPPPPLWRVLGAARSPARLSLSSIRSGGHSALADH